MPGGQGGLKSKAAKKLPPRVASAAAAPVKPHQANKKKRAAPEPAQEASNQGDATPAKRRAKPSTALPEHLPLMSEDPSQSAPEPVLDRKAAEAAKTRLIKREKFGLGKPAGPGGAVVYLGHIPHGFYEEQMKGFFSQFGTVTRLRLARNRKVRLSPWHVGTFLPALHA